MIIYSYADSFDNLKNKLLGLQNLVQASKDSSVLLINGLVLFEAEDNVVKIIHCVSENDAERAKIAIANKLKVIFFKVVSSGLIFELGTHGKLKSKEKAYFDPNQPLPTSGLAANSTTVSPKAISSSQDHKSICNVM